ncbi:MAG: OmpA family protein [Bacteroidota bacterium]
MKTATIISIILAIGLAITSYLLYDSMTTAQAEMAELRDTKDDLLVKVSNLERDKANMSRKLEEQVAEVSDAKEEEIDHVRSMYDTLVTDLQKEIEDGQVKITQLADRLSVTLVDKILFPSGQANLTSGGVKVLRQVGKTLKTTSGKVIRVEGHTDNIPISTNLVEKFPTNWELSTTRATNVVRFLQDKVGIEGNRLQAVGMSEFHPVASNKTRKGRSQNRRIEIALLPDITEAEVPANKADKEE